VSRRPPVSFDGDPHDTADHATRRILAVLLDTVRSLEDGVRRDLDVEFLHDFRVAVRRARSLLGQLDGVLPRLEVKPLVKNLKWLARSTNVMRDLDVHLLCMPEYRRMLSGTESAALDPVAAVLRQRRLAELRALQDALDGSRHASTLRDWERAARGESDDGRHEADGARPIREVAAERILAIYRRVLDDGRAIDDESPPDALHRLRIDCKKLRYLLEFFSDMLDADGLAKPVKALKRLQDNLGRFHDLDLQQIALRDLSAELLERSGPSAECERALATLVELLAQQQRDERARFAECFARFDSPFVRRRIARAIDLDADTAP